MEDNKQFVDGLRAFKPSEKAPDFIKANIVIDVVMLTNWLNENANAEGVVRLVIKESKGGKFYAEKDSFKPQVGNEVARNHGIDDVDPSTLPF